MLSFHNGCASIGAVGISVGMPKVAGGEGLVGGLVLLDRPFFNLEGLWEDFLLLLLLVLRYRPARRS